MLDTGSPREHEGNEPCSAVSPLTSRRTSTSSAPGLSFFDGTPLYLLPFSIPASGIPLEPSSHDMAAPRRKGHPSPIKAAPKQTQGEESKPNSRIASPAPPQESSQDAHISLSHLTTLMRLEQYHCQRSRQAQQHLHFANVTAARTARLSLAARSIQRTLAECIKSEDKHSFVNLFNAFHDALSDCPSPSTTAGRCGPFREGYPLSFLDALPATSQASVLDFITKVKADASFVADRLAALSHKDLMDLLPEKGLSRSNDSIFGSPQKTNSRASRHLGYVVDAQTELLSCHDLPSPLDVLIHSVRGLSHVSLQDDEVATNVWATGCARLIVEQRPGSEKLVPAVIDSWASSSQWPGKERLELWLLRTLQQGSFLLEQPRRQAFAARPAPLPEEDVQREKFYTDAVDSLLSLLVDSEGASIIPPGALRLCEATYAKLQHSPAHQRAFPNFAITRWLFPCFLQDAIVLPEAYGLLPDYFVPEQARQRVLREIASRCYKAVFDVVYSWKLGNTPSDQATYLVRVLAERIGGSERLSRPSLQGLVQLPNESAIVALSASDVLKMVNALYPAPVVSLLNERDSLYCGLRSSASSISGFSLFQQPHHVEAASPSSQGSPQDPLTHTWHSGHEDLAFNDALTTSDATVRSDSEGEQLREICIAIDDLPSGRKESALDHWCILVRSDSETQFSTMHTTHSRISDSAVEARPVEHISPLHESCQNTITELLGSGDLMYQEASLSEPKTLQESFEARIIQALRRRITALEESMEFVQAQSYCRKLRQIRDAVAESPGQAPLNAILDVIAVDKQRSLDMAFANVERCDVDFRSVRSCLDRLSQQLLQRIDTTRRLRDKMWYIADVRTSAPYDGVRSVVSALKTMAKPQKPARTRLAPPSRALNGIKGSITNYHLRSETQLLDLLTAPAGYGGRAKFGDDQSKTLAVWMENNSVENLCRGEERIHMLIMEIQRVTDLAMSENSTLMASELFASDQPHAPKTRSAAGRPAQQGNTGRLDLLSLCTDMPYSVDATSSVSSHARSTTSSKDYLDSWSPSTTNRSAASVWSPVMTEARSPSSVTSVESAQTKNAVFFSNKMRSDLAQGNDQRSLELLRQNMISLLISDVANALFVDGSETDRAFWTGLGGELGAKHLRTLAVESASERTVTTEASEFDFEKAFEQLTSRFAATSNPYVKLQLLRDIDTLLEPYTNDALAVSSEATLQDSFARSHASTAKVLDLKVESFRRLFCKEATRPYAIFRDLQYIAALVPPRMLEGSQQGRAFWNAAVAISGLKQSICKVMVETADSIIAYHSNKRHGRSSSVAQQERDSAAFPASNRCPSPEDVSGRSMSDAALLLQITAREGDAVAQRELATLYLTHPELMDHILAPLSRPRDVFKEELESKWRKNQDPTRCDPTTMCVAHHWMNLSSKGGDALATEFLRQREEIERLPRAT